VTNRVIRRLAVVFGAIVVLMTVAFGPSVIQNLTKKASPPPALATVSLTSFPVVAKATGTLFPQQLMFVNFSTSGLLAATNVKVGNAVTAGQQLAHLDQSAQTAAVASAQAAVAAGQANLANAEASNNAQQIAAARSQIANAQAQLQAANAALASTVLVAPESSTVLEINSQVGQSITAGVTHVPALSGSSSGIIDPASVASSAASNAFIVLGSASAYQVSAAFDQQNAAQLSLGQTGTIGFDAVPGLSIPGTVAAIDSNASQVNGVPEYFASVTLKATDPRLRSGMTVTVLIDIAQANNVLSVPNQALYTLNGTQYVDVWFHRTQVPTAVTTGLIGDKFAQITSGLSEGQQVVTSPGQSLPSPGPSPT
jgi:multidrug efflux pump subunit AcrA (membrane-fusion protein)